MSTLDSQKNAPGSSGQAVLAPHPLSALTTPPRSPDTVQPPTASAEQVGGRGNLSPSESTEQERVVSAYARLYEHYSEVDEYGENAAVERVS